ncbi:hypothetical protein ACLOJK_005045 [Asimina triloba]
MKQSQNVKLNVHYEGKILRDSERNKTTYVGGLQYIYHVDLGRISLLDLQDEIHQISNIPPEKQHVSYQYPDIDISEAFGSITCDVDLMSMLGLYCTGDWRKIVSIDVYIAVANDKKVTPSLQGAALMKRIGAVEHAEVPLSPSTDNIGRKDTLAASSIELEAAVIGESNEFMTTITSDHWDLGSVDMGADLGVESQWVTFGSVTEGVGGEDLNEAENQMATEVDMGEAYSIEGEGTMKMQEPSFEYAARDSEDSDVGVEPPRIFKEEDLLK